ncbi:MAG TPA: HipA family kinase [Pseudoneobacillus sp.]|nr:HipA family kinase [Pseudoneobacillus sp.]
MLQEVPRYKLSVTSDCETTQNQYGGLSPKIMATVEGQQVLVKGQDGNEDESFAEFFCYRLASAIGLNVNKVKLIDCGTLLGLGKICSVHWWEHDFVCFAKLSKEEKEALTAEEKNPMLFFDDLINNQDRHGYNYGKVNDDIFLIDHGYARPWERINGDDLEWLYRSSKKIGCKDVVEKFMSLTEQDFIKMCELNDDLEIDKLYFDYYAGRIIDRMTAVQKHILKMCEEEKVEAERDLASVIVNGVEVDVTLKEVQ